MKNFNEPVRVLTVVATLLVLLQQFGVPLSEGQVISIQNFVEAGLGLLVLIGGGEMVRSKVDGPATARAKDAVINRVLAKEES